MAYKNPSDQARWKREKYHRDPGYRRKEIERKKLYQRLRKHTRYMRLKKLVDNAIAHLETHHLY